MDGHTVGAQHISHPDHKLYLMVLVLNKDTFCLSTHIGLYTYTHPRVGLHYKLDSI